MSKHLVVGLGQVGIALQTVLSEGHEVLGMDYPWITPEGDYADFDFVHVCFPHRQDFIELVERLRILYLRRDGILVVHSTVPMGTCDRLHVVHSPIRGVHPNLVDGILEFVKYFGGVRALEASAPFNDLGIKTHCVYHAATTEALKLFDTLQYGVAIRVQKEIKRYCDLYGLNYDLVYRHANYSYNQGYDKLGMPDVRRPVLKDMPGKIGGHCIIPNAEITEIQLARELLRFNDMLK